MLSRERLLPVNSIFVAYGIFLLVQYFRQVFGFCAVKFLFKFLCVFV